MDDHQFRKLLEAFNRSWSGYRKVRRGVRKRLGRHMARLGCAGVDDYLAVLGCQPDARRECERLLTVPISRFFRDRRLWADLEAVILPELVAAFPRGVRVWSAGCARGEEVYSFKILWQRLAATVRTLPALELTATDLNPETIALAEAGRYGPGSLKEVDAATRASFFEEKSGGRRFDVRNFLKTDIRWEVRDLRAGPPEGAFQLVFLRNNLLTYYGEPLRTEGLRRVAGGLAAGGWLIVGAHEKLPPTDLRLIRHTAVPWAYRNSAAEPA